MVDKLFSSKMLIGTVVEVNFISERELVPLLALILRREFWRLVILRRESIRFFIWGMSW